MVNSSFEKNYLKLSKKNLEFSKNNKQLDIELVKTDSLPRKRNERIKIYQKTMKDLFSPLGSTNELIKFVTDHTGFYRQNLMNHSHHEKHDKVAK